MKDTVLNNNSFLSNIILRTSILTLGTMFCVFAYGTAIFGLFDPHYMADFCENLGADTASAHYYEIAYKKSGNNEDLYLTLDKYILVSNHKKTAYYAERFFAIAHADYKTIIDKVNSYMAQNGGAGIDEDVRLKYAYINSLMAIGEEGKATAFYNSYFA